MSTLHCMFCGGKECKYENYKLWIQDKEHPNAVEGVFSNWITTDILAMARPSNKQIKEYKLIDAFQSENIGAIFNLQLKGEHEFCGDGNDPSSGFSYSPEVFEEVEIKHYNFGWTDMDTPSFELVLKIVQTMQKVVLNGKTFAVHCHAGLGRTGLSIACFLVHHRKMKPEQAIRIVRSQRPLSIQTSKQQQFVHQFHLYLQNLHRVFNIQHSKVLWKSVTFDNLMSHQRLLMGSSIQSNQQQNSDEHGPSSAKFSNETDSQPHLLVKRIIQQLSVLMAKTSQKKENRTQLEEDILCRFLSRTDVYDISKEELELMNEVNHGRWQVITKIDHPFGLVNLLIFWLFTLEKPLCFIPSFLKTLYGAINNNESFLNASSELPQDVFQTLNCFLDIIRECSSASPSLLNACLYVLAGMMTPIRESFFVHSPNAATFSQTNLSGENKLDMNPLLTPSSSSSLAKINKFLSKNSLKSFVSYLPPISTSIKRSISVPINLLNTRQFSSRQDAVFGTQSEENHDSSTGVTSIPTTPMGPSEKVNKKKVHNVTEKGKSKSTEKNERLNESTKLDLKILEMKDSKTDILIDKKQKPTSLSLASPIHTNNESKQLSATIEENNTSNSSSPTSPPTTFCQDDPQQALFIYLQFLMQPGNTLTNENKVTTSGLSQTITPSFMDLKSVVTMQVASDPCLLDQQSKNLVTIGSPSTNTLDLNGTEKEKSI